jgi:small subunit ribosomal protein S18
MVPEATTAAAPQQSRNPLDFTFMDVEALTRYVTETGKILPRRITGLTSAQLRHAHHADQALALDAADEVTLPQSGAFGYPFTKPAPQRGGL